MNIPNRFEVASWQLERPPTGICFSPTGSLLHAYDGRKIYTWTLPEFDREQRFSINNSEQSREGHCQFIGGGQNIMLIASDDNSEAGIHHVTVRELVSHTLKIEADIHVEHYGVMGTLFNHAENQLLFTDCGGTSHFIEFPSCARLRSMELDASTFGPRGSCDSIIFSPDETELWGSCGHDEPNGYREYLAAFDLNTGKGIRRQPPQNGNHIDGLRLTPDFDTLLSVEEKALCFRELDSWKLLRKIDLEGALQRGWGRSTPAITFTSDSRMVALSCEYNQKVCLAQCETAKLIGVFDVDDDFCVRLLSFSSDGRYLAIASYDVRNEVRVWDVSAVL